MGSSKNSQENSSGCVQLEFRQIHMKNPLNFSVFFWESEHLIVMRCATCYHLYNFKKVKNTHGGVLILIKL